MYRREVGAFKEAIVGWLLIGGLVLTVVFAGLTWVFSVSGVYRGTYTREPFTNKIQDAGALNLVPLTFAGFFLGILCMMAGVGYGLYSHYNRNTGIRKSIPEFKVLARYCYDRTQQLISEQWDIDVADNPRFYVRGVTPDGIVGEYETSMEVYYNCGEGMTGEAELQGKWIGRFLPYVGPQSGE